MKRIFSGYALAAFIHLFCACTGQSTTTGCGPMERKHPVTTTPHPVSYEVRIADDLCKEDRSAVADSGENVTLVCSGDAGTVRILLPRKEWYAILRDKAGSQPAPVGK